MHQTKINLIIYMMHSQKRYTLPQNNPLSLILTQSPILRAQHYSNYYIITAFCGLILPPSYCGNQSL